MGAERKVDDPAARVVSHRKPVRELVRARVRQKAREKAPLWVPGHDAPLPEVRTVPPSLAAHWPHGSPDDEVLLFHLPLPPNLANARMHWRVKHAEQARYVRLLDSLLTVQRLPMPPEEPWSHGAVEALLVLGNHMDHDNAMARLKWPLDWLVRRGYLEDDGRRHLTWQGLPHQLLTRKAPPSLHLSLRRVE
jgi:hypothetical protein